MAKSHVTASVKSTAPRGADLDLEHHEQLDMAASYIERSMGRIRICIAALENSTATDRELFKHLADMLDQDVHNDLDAAREIFQTWRTQEAAGKPESRALS
jgi:hypothetical protein